MAVLARLVQTPVVAPTKQPLTVAEIKLFCGISHALRDNDISDDIKAAVDEGQNYTGRQFVAATYDAVLDAFPWGPNDDDDVIELPRPPLQSVTSIIYVDTDGASQTLNATNYTVDTDSLWGRIYPAYGYSWPSTRDQRNAVRIRFVTGYPLDGSSNPTTPYGIRRFIKRSVATTLAMKEMVLPETDFRPLPREVIFGSLDPFVLHRVPK